MNSNYPYILLKKLGLFAGHPTVNDDLPNPIANGQVKIKCNVKCFTKHGVEFEDGTHEEIDCVITLKEGGIIITPCISGYNKQLNLDIICIYICCPAAAPHWF